MVWRAPRLFFGRAVYQETEVPPFSSPNLPPPNKATCLGVISPALWRAFLLPERQPQHPEHFRVLGIHPLSAAGTPLSQAAWEPNEHKTSDGVKQRVLWVCFKISGEREIAGVSPGRKTVCSERDTKKLVPKAHNPKSGSFQTWAWTLWWTSHMFGFMLPINCFLRVLPKKDIANKP